MQSNLAKHRQSRKLFAIEVLYSLNWSIIIVVLGLVGFGLLMVYEASAVTALRNFGDRFHFLREQLKWTVTGGLGMIVFALYPYRNLYRLSAPFLTVIIIFLIAVFLPGIGVGALGAKRWVNFAFFSIQPAEFAKLALVIYLAAWLSKADKMRLTPFISLLGLVIGLVILEPDLGTAIIILAIAGILYFLSGAPWYHFLFLIPTVFITVGVISLISPYRLNRLETFFNPNTDPLGSSYHVRQIIISLGSGGWLGRGLGRSLQKYDFLPEATTDSIFAIIGEEFGFIGAVMLIITFFLLISLGFKIIARTTDPFGRLLSAGIVIWLGIQAMINLSAMVILVPLTGIPLPFISYGGSSLVASLCAVGILLNIGSSHVKK